MLTALLQSNGTKVLAQEALKGLGDFICPACRGSLILRKGLVKVHHFAHKADSGCTYRGESQLHLRIKNDIYQRLYARLSSRVKNIELEKYLGNVRPDVYVEGNKKKIAIEVQASGMSAREIISRTLKYYKKRIHVLWVLPLDRERMMQTDPANEAHFFSVFRLKEYERAIYYMYFKTLTLWDVSHEFSHGFIALKLDDCWTDETEFYSLDWNASVTFDPKKHKMKKRPVKVDFDIQLEDFQLTYARRFKVPQGRYDLPPRLIVNYPWKPSAE